MEVKGDLARGFSLGEVFHTVRGAPQHVVHQRDGRGVAWMGEGVRVLM